MKEQRSIPVGKVQRAAKFVTTGAKIGGNYIKHYTKKAFNPDLDREELDRDNAEDIYKSLSQLKGSALKMAQMMSMDKHALPQAYRNKFIMAQYSAPPLSYPLVVKTFRKYFGQSPDQLFDSFTQQAVNAASIGQVHQATKDGKTLAVKIQYPGVADSVVSDLKLVRPIAVRMMNLPDKDLDVYFDEVKGKLLEETDYELELRRSKEISAACKRAIPDLAFPEYYEQYSSPRIITMDWLDGLHLDEFLKTNPPQAVRNRVGQALWDFYEFQIHHLKQLHADPHPGNFLLQADGKVGIIDFGCVKELPLDFYEGYFQLVDREVAANEAQMKAIFKDLQFLYDSDTPDEEAFFFDLFRNLLLLLAKPFHGDSFDFSDKAYFEEIFTTGERLSKMKELRESKVARGSQHGLYLNRTYFGLYNILHDLEAEIDTRRKDFTQQAIEVPA